MRTCREHQQDFCVSGKTARLAAKHQLANSFAKRRATRFARDDHVMAGVSYTLLDELQVRRLPDPLDPFYGYECPSHELLVV